MIIAHDRAERPRPVNGQRLGACKVYFLNWHASNVTHSNHDLQLSAPAPAPATPHNRLLITLHLPFSY